MKKYLLRITDLRIALLIVMIINGLFFWNLLKPQGSFLNLMDKQWVDIIMRSRGTTPVSPEVAIVAIDTKSVDAYGRWPWPRRRIAKLVDVLNEHYAVRTIGFDIVFSEPEHDESAALSERVRAQLSRSDASTRSSSEFILELIKQARNEMNGDRQLGASLANTPNSILGYFFFVQSGHLAHLSKEEQRPSAERIRKSEISFVRGSYLPGTVPKGYGVESNIPVISEGGTLSGYFNMFPDPEDGTVRRVHLLTELDQSLYPSLDLQILRHYYGNAPIQVEATPEAGIVGIQLQDLYIETDFDGSIQLNYKGPGLTIPHYSVYDLLERSVPQDALRDRIVLIGATEAGIFDLRTTPVDVAYPGVEVHATLLENLISGSYFRKHLLNDLFTILLILAVGLFLGIVLPRVKSFYGALLALAMLVGYTFAHRWMVNELLTWTSYIYVSLSILSVWIAVTLFRYLVSDKDRRFIRGAFQQYLSPEVISQLVENPDLLRLGGERRRMTAFFSDVQGFSSISEDLDPSELVALLNDYLTEMTDIITEYGGTVDKYEGDAIIAFFGAPLPQEDHARRACLVSLSMQKRLAEMRENWAQEGRPQLHMRIGLNTGLMVVGNMGSRKRFDYTMMGNSVNLAARLEGANKNYGTFLCASEFTYEDAREAVEVREIDLIRVVGIQQPVRLYELLAERGKLSAAQLAAQEAFAKGLAQYRAQDWDAAESSFQQVLQAIPEDPPAKTFIDRCQLYRQQPPLPAGEEEWDGVFVASSK